MTFAGTVIGTCESDASKTRPWTSSRLTSSRRVRWKNLAGGVGGLLFNFSDGFRYGLAVSDGSVATPLHGLPSELAAVTFPWLEFLAVSAIAAGASVLFWRVWFGRRPLLQTRPALALVIATVACLIVAAQLEAALLQ